MAHDLNTQLGTQAVLWDLQPLYASPQDVRLAEDMAWCLEVAEQLSHEAKGRLELLDAATILHIVRGLESIDMRLARLGTYAFLNFITQTDNAQASALLQKVEELEAKVGKITVFFQLEWNSLPEERVGGLLADDLLSPYNHYLGAMRRFASHQLAAQEEELLQELRPIGRGAWNLLFEKVFGKMRFGRQHRTEEEVLSDLYHPDQEVRKNAADEMTAALQEHSHVLTHIFNTLSAEKMISDRLRSYPSWDSAMNLENELADSTVSALISAVTSRYEIVHRYYTLKKSLLHHEELFDFDRYAPVPGGDESLIPWDRCRAIITEAFARFSPEMQRIAELFFDKQWIHAPVVSGKRGGAFAHPCIPDVHPYILVNYTGNLRDVSTVAHELGHGIHQYLAGKQGYYNSDTPLVLAETASVFAELLVFHSQMELLEDIPAKRAFLCQKLESIFATVFRQVAMNRFEKAMHSARRNQGELSREELSALWMETQQAMFGTTVTLREDYDIWWSYIPHFLSTPGYVYSYAFGELLVLALYSLYVKEGASFIDKYLAFLAQGGNGSPAELLLPFGIDLSSASFWHGGLDVIEKMLADAESLI